MLAQLTAFFPRLHCLLTVSLPYTALRSHHLTWRIGPCADRDYEVEDKDRYEFHDFVEEKDMANLKTFIEGVKAFSGRGCDFAEDVAGGLKKALSLTWKGETRIIIHIADAPAHGSEYNGGCNDKYPGPQDPDRMLPPQDSNHGCLSSRHPHASRPTADSRTSCLRILLQRATC